MTDLDNRLEPYHACRHDSSCAFHWTHYKRYADPFVVDSSKIKVVWAIANDKLPNRTVTQYRLKGD